MKQITSTKESKITVVIPEGWHEVPLSAFMEYYKRIEGKPSGMEQLISIETFTHAPIEVLQNDVSIARDILPYMTWVHQLPTVELLTTFTHQGEEYEHVGNLEKVNAGQFEALLAYLEQAKGNPVQAAPNLMAVLYKEQGKAQNSESVMNAAEAFLSLPVSVAWHAVAFFLTSSEPYAKRIHAYFQSRNEMLKMANKLEEAVKNLPSQTLFMRILVWLASRYINSVSILLQKS